MTNPRDEPREGSKKKKNWKDKLILSSIALCLSVGLLFLFNRQISQWIVHWRGDNYAQQSADQMKKNKGKGSFDASSVKALSATELMKAQLDKQDLPVIGVLAIPNLQINLPVFSGDGYDTMMYGGGTMKPNQEMGQGNYAIASHTIFDYYGNPIQNLLFGNLVHAKANQMIYLTDKENVYEYAITSITQVNVAQGDVITDHKNQKEITLITCVDFNVTPMRWVVHGKYLKTVPFNEQTAQPFGQKFNQ